MTEIEKQLKSKEEEKNSQTTLLKVKKKYSPVCLSLSSSDTEQEEETYKRRKIDKISALRRKLEADIIKRADRSSNSSSNISEQIESDRQSSDAIAEIRDDVINRVVKGLNRERKDGSRLSIDDLNARVK